MEREQFEQIYNKYRKLVFGIAFGTLRDREEANYIVQETFMHIFEKWNMLSDPSDSESLKSFIVNIAKNKSLEHWKRKKKQEVEDFNKDHLTLYFDLDEFSKEEIVDVVALLSGIYESIGGDGLEIKKMDTFEFSESLIPVWIWTIMRKRRY